MAELSCTLLKCFLSVLCVCVCCVQEMGASVTEEELRELISEVDINKNATIEEEEFLKVYTMCSVCVCVCWMGVYIYRL